MRNKIISILTIACMIAALFPLTMLKTNAASFSFSGKNYTSDVDGAAALDNVFAKYKEGYIYSGSGQCCGFANAVGEMIAEMRTTTFAGTKSLNSDNFKNMCVGVKAGAHLRVSNIANDDGGEAAGHSIVLIKVTNDTVYWVDCNFKYTGEPDNIIHYYSSSISSFISRYSDYAYITRLHETKSYRKSVSTVKTYTLKYSDGLSSTSNDSSIIASQTIESGVSTKTSTKKFTRTGYKYSNWHILKYVDGKAHYWCVNKATDKDGKWIRYDDIPSDYGKVVFPHGGSIYFTVSDTVLYLTPVWEKCTYTLRYSDGMSATSYDEDSKVIPNQTIEYGVSTKTSTKKFTRAGYKYSNWYIFKYIDGKAHYWCVNKATDKDGKWIRYDDIPSDYGKVVFPHGGSIYFTVSDTILYLTPVWEKTTEIKDSAISIKNKTAVLSATSYTYNGSIKKPTVTISGLNPGTDFTVSYKDSSGKTITSPTNAGNYKVVITGKGNYTGTITKTFSIVKANQTIGVATEFNKVYGNQAFKLGASAAGKLTYKTSNKKVATVSNSGKIIIKNTGRAAITITAAATGNHNTAVKTVTINVSPKKVASVKAKSSSKKKVTISWKKDKKADGYEIVYSTDKKFKKSMKKVNISKNKTIKKTISKLKSRKTYYVKVRAYKKAGGTKIYGPYSSVKRVKIK